MEGRVQVRGVAETRPAARVDATTVLDVDPSATRFVGRGGHKLAAALDAFAIVVAGKAALDVGAATGGFTDCLLQRGAASVVAVDVGTGQLHPDLVADHRVRDLERTDIRTFDPSAAGGPFEIVTADVSFVSLVPLAPAIARCATMDGHVVVLVKPQFEAGPGRRTKDGVVADGNARQQAVAAVAAAFAEIGWAEAGRVDSPLSGAAGNRETLLWLRHGGEEGCDG